MSKKVSTRIIYVSGFGYRYDGVRKFLLKFWQIYGVRTEFVSMCWEDGQSYESKLSRINAAIDRNIGSPIVLIGESAGASIVINTYASRSREIHKAMSLCGKNHGANKVAERYFSKSPAFKESIHEADRNGEDLSETERRNFTSIYALYDPVIPRRESIVAGSRHVRLWTVGHLTTILLGLSALSWIVVREAKK